MRKVSQQCGVVLNGSPQMLHVHVLLVAPLGAGDMAQLGTGQHESRVANREIHHTGAADLPVEPFNGVIGTDAGPMLTGKIAVSQRFLNAIFYFLSGLFQLHGAQLFHHSVFLLSSFLAFLGVDYLEYLCHSITLE